MSKNLKMGKALQDFVAFIKKYGVIGLAIGVVVGAAVKDLVDSLVADLLNPILGIFLADGSLDSWVLDLNPAEDAVNNLMLGSFLNALISFLILMVVVYLIIKVVLSKFVTDEELDQA